MSTFLQDRLEATLRQINLYEAALEALMTNAIQSYTIDTGQTKQVVTKADLFKLQQVIDMLYNRYIVIEARIGNGGTVTMGADW